MKTNDIYIAAFPKSGITYLGWLLVSARLLHNGIRLQPTFFNIDTLLIDTHKFNEVESRCIWTDGMGNFYKTHHGWVPSCNAIYLIRNPVDTLKSYWHFSKACGGKPHMTQFLDTNISLWKSHVESWLHRDNPSQSLVFVQYENLMRSPGAVLRGIFANLGIAPLNEHIQQAIANSTLDEMRMAEETFTKWNPIYQKYNLEFVRKSDVRKVEEFNDKVMARIQRECGALYESVIHGR